MNYIVRLKQSVMDHENMRWSKMTDAELEKRLQKITHLDKLDAFMWKASQEQKWTLLRRADRKAELTGEKTSMAMVKIPSSRRSNGRLRWMDSGVTITKVAINSTKKMKQKEIEYERDIEL